MRFQEIDLEGFWRLIICYNAYLGQDNAGFTHTDFKRRLSIVGIGRTTSKDEFINTIAHEAKHIQSHICQYYNVDEDSEDAAYLLGYIVMKMYLVFKEYI